MTYTTQTQVRIGFWANHIEYHRVPRNKQNDYPADVRVAFVDYVDSLVRDGKISEKLAARVTL